MKDFFKYLCDFVIPVLMVLFLLLGIGYFLIQIERSDINELRYCPHCSEQLLK